MIRRGSCVNLGSGLTRKGGTESCTNIARHLTFIGPCIILIVEQKETNLMSLILLLAYLMLNIFRMLIHPSSGACDLFVELFHGLYCSGTMCVGVTLWFGWGGVVS